MLSPNIALTKKRPLMVSWILFMVLTKSLMLELIKDIWEISILKNLNDYYNRCIILVRVILIALCANIEILASENWNKSIGLINSCVQTHNLIINDSMKKINKKHGAFSVDGRLYINFSLSK